MLFLGVHGVSADAGLTTPNLLEAETDRALVAASERIVVVADHTKWGVRGLSQIAGLDEVDVFVSDHALDADARAAIGEHVERVLIAPRPRRTRVRRSGVSTSTRADLRHATGLTGVRTFVVDSRQDRPNLPAAGCPFCPGGLEAPETYDVRWFRESLAGDAGRPVRGRALHPPARRDLLVARRRRCAQGLDLWAERTAALGARPDVEYVLVFENRGADVGATITHPHGQIYAFEFVPDLPRRALLGGTKLGEPGDGLVAVSPGWRAWVPEASVYPYAVRLVPDDPVPDLPSLNDAGRDALAGLLVDVLERFDRLFDAETPYMLWIHQRPFDGRDWPHARLHVEIVTPWRAPGVTRFVAAGELGSGVFFNPVAPAAAAQSLRDAV